MYNLLLSSKRKRRRQQNDLTLIAMLISFTFYCLLFILNNSSYIFINGIVITSNLRGLPTTLPKGISNNYFSNDNINRNDKNSIRTTMKMPSDFSSKSKTQNKFKNVLYGKQLKSSNNRSPIIITKVYFLKLNEIFKLLYQKGFSRNSNFLFSKYI